MPVDLGSPIDLDQEAGLRDWLYDFLVAFSVSGSDSLAAAFYLREGVENPEGIEHLKKFTERRGFLKGNTPFAAFKAGHMLILKEAERDYFFGNVSFFDSVFKVFEAQGVYDSYAFYLQTHGMAPRGRIRLQTQAGKGN